MLNAKQQVLKVVEQLPDDCSIEDIQYQLYVLETLQRRAEMAEQGDFVSQEEAEKRMDKWQ